MNNNLLLFTFSLILYSHFAFTQSAEFNVDELQVLKKIWRELGLTKNKLDSYMYLCSGQANLEGVSADCDCSFESNTTCRVTKITITSQNVSTFLPSEFAKLQYLQSLDLSRNYLEGTIPFIWTTMRLSTLSLMGNRLNERFPISLTKMITLTDLSIEGNLFFGVLPKDIANLHNLEKLDLSSNNFFGELPVTLSKLTKLTDVRISDNDFGGKIPNFISQWTQIGKLHIQGCMFEGPIPSSISALTQLNDLRISDLIGGASTFPPLDKLKQLNTLVLRNCFIHGPIPNYVGNLRSLQTLDLSFNNLTGNIPPSFLQLDNAHYIYLTENNLTGSVPRWTMMNAKVLDISYNNFTYDAFGPKACDRWPINVVESYSLSTNQQNDIHPCLMKNFPCKKPNEHIHSLHINCGGKEVNISNTIIYKADTERMGASSYYNDGNWAFSSTGNFLDDDRGSDAYILFNTSDLLSIPTSDTELYTTARTAAISLTYYGLCLVNGNYNVTLHFAEIVFTQDELRDSLGKRVFNVYVQGDLKLKDFDIVNVAGGTGIAVIRSYRVNVKNNTLKIQLYWAGKGTTGIPFRGSYGPIISAISVEPFFPHCRHCGKTLSAGLVAGIVGGVCVVLLIMLVLWRRGYMMTKNQLIETGHLSTSTSFS